MQESWCRSRAVRKSETAHCFRRHLHGAGGRGQPLVVAKLCRLSRDAAFEMTHMKHSKVRFRVASMSQAGNFQLGIWAVLNMQEREMISRRAREALAAAKARGDKWEGQAVPTPPSQR